ncbi:LamG domain-containing protein [Candidatus Saccharibacteria bacterium]|nr:LamG domain-containing protein [Candidatus Saccharibacteria bacterium]
MRNTSKRAAFTIVELIVVIVVIAIIATISVVAYNGVQRDARDKAILSDMSALKGIVTRYALKHQGEAKAWYSESGPDADLDFEPSDGTVLDLVFKGDQFCIRGYNEAANKNSITNGYTDGSTEDACLMLDASVAAGGTGGVVQGWWKLNGNAVDSSGSGRNGTVFGATPTSDRNGAANNAYAFSDTATQWIQTPYNFPYSRLTVSAWIKPTGDSLQGFGGIVSNTRDCCSTYYGFQLQFNKSNASVTSRLWWGSNQQTRTYTSYPYINQWSQMVLTYDGQMHRLYINGQEYSSIALTQDLGTPAYNVSIGKGGWSSSGYSFGGDIDDVRILDYALSADDVQAMYNRGPQ